MLAALAYAALGLAIVAMAARLVLRKSPILRFLCGLLALMAGGTFLLLLILIGSVAD